MSIIFTEILTGIFTKVLLSIFTDCFAGAKGAKRQPLCLKGLPDFTEPLNPRREGRVRNCYFLHNTKAPRIRCASGERPPGALLLPLRGNSPTQPQADGEQRATLSANRRGR